MSLCQLIHKEIQKITYLQVDTDNLDPKEYDKLIDRIPKEIEILEILQKILTLEPQSIVKLEYYLQEMKFDTSNSEVWNAFAFKLDKITNGTIFYLDDLDYQEYEVIFPEAKVLPKKLKCIFGKFFATNTMIEKIDLLYIQNRVDVEWCDKLKEVSINHVESLLNLRGSSKVEFVKIEFVKKDLSIVGCSSLTIDRLESTSSVNAKIKIGGTLRIKRSPLENYTEKELLEKFDVDPDKIIRN